MRCEDGRTRVVIEGVKPEIDGGRFPIKRTVGEKVVVEADVFADGHEALSCVLLHRKEGAPQWTEVPMELLVNDRWRGEFTVSELGRYRYTLQAWVDRFQSWQKDLQKKVDAGQDVSVELQVGAGLIREARGRASGDDSKRLESAAGTLIGKGKSARKARAALD
jgi:starch synthase (maltosyl-transferring)